MGSDASKERSEDESLGRSKELDNVWNAEGLSTIFATSSSSSQKLVQIPPKENLKIADILQSYAYSQVKGELLVDGELYKVQRGLWTKCGVKSQKAVADRTPRKHITDDSEDTSVVYYSQKHKKSNGLVYSQLQNTSTEYKYICNEDVTNNCCDDRPKSISDSTENKNKSVKSPDHSDVQDTDENDQPNEAPDEKKIGDDANANADDGIIRERRSPSSAATKMIHTSKYIRVTEDVITNANTTYATSKHRENQNGIALKEAGTTWSQKTTSMRLPESLVARSRRKRTLLRHNNSKHTTQGTLENEATPGVLGKEREQKNATNNENRSQSNSDDKISSLDRRMVKATRNPLLNQDSNTILYPSAYKKCNGVRRKDCGQLDNDFEAEGYPKYKAGSRNDMDNNTAHHSDWNDPVRGKIRCTNSINTYTRSNRTDDTNREEDRLGNALKYVCASGQATHRTCTSVHHIHLNSSIDEHSDSQIRSAKGTFKDFIDLVDLENTNVTAGPMNCDMYFERDSAQEDIKRIHKNGNRNSNECEALLPTFSSDSFSEDPTDLLSLFLGGTPTTKYNKHQNEQKINTRECSTTDINTSSTGEKISESDLNMNTEYGHNMTKSADGIVDEYRNTLINSVTRNKGNATNKIEGTAKNINCERHTLELQNDENVYNIKKERAKSLSWRRNDRVTTTILLTKKTSDETSGRTIRINVEDTDSTTPSNVDVDVYLLSSLRNSNGLKLTTTDGKGSNTGTKSVQDFILSEELWKRIKYYAATPPSRICLKQDSRSD